MQQQQFIIEELNENGPIVLAEIHTNVQTFLYNKNNPQTALYKKARLLIDTGASISGLDKNLIQLLQLPEYTALAQVEGAGGLVQLKKYRCVLYLPIFLQKGLPLDIVEGNFLQTPYEGILGRDVLQFCHFEYNGQSKKYILKAINF
ncbi:retropepsin-like aspartic protease [Hydrotalea sp.]|uniref:retropepsin-like aspartic protease n=1 Tax=Hydrotalea sp. TaxID=2881279 RepID=UPI0026110A22|nr:retropepsin-like aspartic protease [Hydrotalea sp.]